MKEKVITRQKIRQMDPEVISIDSSSPESPPSISMPSSPSNHKDSSDSHAFHEVLSEASSSLSEHSQESESQRGFLNNLAPVEKKKKNSGILSILRETSLLEKNFQPSMVLKKAEVNALMHEIENSEEANESKGEIVENQECYQNGDGKDYHEQNNGKQQTMEKQADINPSKSQKKKRTDYSQVGSILSSDLSEQNQSSEKVGAKGSKKGERKINKSIECPEDQGSCSNSNLFENCKPRKKPKKMEELEADLNKPTEELSVQVAKIEEEKKRRRKEERRREKVFERRKQELKVGKKKDQMSNTVFNAIQDYFN